MNPFIAKKTNQAYERNAINVYVPSNINMGWRLVQDNCLYNQLRRSLRYKFFRKNNEINHSKKFFLIHFFLLKIFLIIMFSLKVFFFSNSFCNSLRENNQKTLVKLSQKYRSSCQQLWFFPQRIIQGFAHFILIFK
ncbi:unnamed protein product [Paramecium sonneborni]|uniref:Transmembrane protein n=1 Tax=Paramecium sonneborni TaxID=65129 RepID=A0A8S1RAU3_9CILI|nr:unnamed protein product [Paramecium sonneborni]